MQTQTVENLKNQGQAHLRSNRIADAMTVYGQVLILSPEDVDALLVLGDAFLVAEDRTNASALYRQAKKYSPDNKEVKKRFSILNLEEYPGEDAAVLNISDLVNSLIRKLTGISREISDHEIERARILLDEILEHESPAQAVADHLEQIEHLLPALIEINLRQAKSEGNTELVSALEKIKSDILLHDDQERLSKGKFTPRIGKSNCGSIKILLTGSQSQENPFRQNLIARSLQQKGYETIVANGKDEWMSWETFDLAIVQNPHGNTRLARDFAGFFASGKPILLDLGADFEILPETHPEVDSFGLQKAWRKRLYYGILNLASYITTANSEFAANLQKTGLPARYIPDAWDQTNNLWFEANKPRRSLNIGLACFPDQEKDVLSIRRLIARVMREFPHTRLIVSGDLKSYQLFDAISDDRKLFLPIMPGDEDFPFMFSHMDILLMPMRDTYFNQLRSDRRLMEAGIRKIPWIASDMRMVSIWAKGGLVVQSPNDWYVHLHNLIVDQNLRNKLGEEGYRKAQDRSTEKIGALWEKLFQEVFEHAERDRFYSRK